MSPILAMLRKEAPYNGISRLPDEFESYLFPETCPVRRCIESAWLGFGEATIDASLNGVDEKDSGGEYIIKVNELITEELAVNLRRLLVTVLGKG